MLLPKNKSILLGAGIAVFAGMSALIYAIYSPRVAPLRAAVGFKGSPRLVSVEDVPDYCAYPEEDQPRLINTANDDTNLFDAFKEPSVYADSTSDITRPPERKIQDTDPIYVSVAVDTRLDEVLLQDTNTWSIRIFDRTENTPADAPRSEPKRIIGGPKTDVQFNSSIYVDPANGDSYSVENDIGDSVVVFSHDDQVNGFKKVNGDIPPTRKLKITHRGYAIATDEETQEMFISIQYPPQVAVYAKAAAGTDKPKRLLIGPNTKLSDVHGVAVDAKRKLLFVNNWGNISDYREQGTGRFEPASISVYPMDADGNTAPMRIIQGPKTQLDWPAAMSVDPDSGDLYVANDMGQSILVFHEGDQGDAKPHRVIKGRKTFLSYPTGVFVDTKNKEIWATNMGNSSATVYPLNASGDVAPIRRIRSSSADKRSLRFGKTQALAYDSKRQQVLVPNCVTHPQIAMFERMAHENTPPVRALEGEKTMISRTMHAFAYDAIHDEIVVTSPLAQAILIFRGAASGEEKPIRVIQGPHTGILGTAYCGNDKVSIDPVNNEILLPLASGQAGCGGGTANGVLVFDRMANGDAPPKRTLKGPDTQITSPSPIGVDPVRNLLLVNNQGSMLIFDRLADGNTKPKAVIRGPKTEMTRIDTFGVYPEKGWILGGCTDGAICAWSIDNPGDVPPRWKIPVRKLTGYTPSGLVIDPVHKEILLSAAGQRVRPDPSTIMNTIITFSWPEVF